MVTTLRLAALAAGLAPVLLSAGTASAAVYGGETSQRDPIAITLTKKGQVKTIGVMWSAQCQSGQRFDFGNVMTAAKKKPSVIGPGDNPLFAGVKKGKLSGTALGSEDFGDQGSGAIAQKFSAKLKPKTASGTWSAHMDVVDGEGKTIDSCDTGTLHWVALRGPTVYGGATTQGDPVVVITKKDRSKLDYFGFGWHASCTPDGAWHIGEEFGNFPVTAGGSFGDTFTDEYPFDDNSGKNSFTYTINGSLKKTKGSGTLSVHVAATDSSGATMRTCDTNSVHWSVAQ
jgi:hypothetical protein